MADESMSVDQEVNGEETSSVPQVNGVDIADEQDEVKLDGKETENAVVTEETSFKEDNSPDSPIELNYEEDSPSQEKIKENIDNEDIACDDDAKENSNGLNNKQDNIPDTPVVISKSRKRKASSDDDQELNGFDPPEQPSPLIKARIDKLEKDIKEAEQDPARWTSSRPPLKKAHLASPAHSIEMSSRPSSGLSVRSESELIGGHVSDLNSSVSSPSATPKIRKSTVDLSNPLYRIPLEQGWKRELVYRATVDQYQRRQGDIYYYTPAGKKLRSNREVSEHLAGTGLSMEHFTFFKEPLGVDDPEKEIIRDAKLMRNRTDSPVNTVEKSPASAALIREGKRTPKPKGPKGASPERGNVLTPKLTTPFKVKSMGSRLSGQGSPATSAAPVKVAAKELAKTLPVTKKTTAKWKKKGDLGSAEYSIQSQAIAETIGAVRYPTPLIKYGTQAGEMSPKSGRELCSIHCPNAKGEIPSLQCSLCLCLYHTECAGITSNISTSFTCKSCQITQNTQPLPPPLTHISAMKPTQKPSPSRIPSPPALHRIPKDPPVRIPQPLLVPVVKRFPVPKTLKTTPKFVNVSKNDSTDASAFKPIQAKKNIVGSVTTWLPPASSIQLGSKNLKQVSPQTSGLGDFSVNRFPQTIAIVNGKKYIVIPKHNVLNVSSQFPGNGGNPIPKQAENAPKVVDPSQQTAGSPTPSLKLKLKIGEDNEVAIVKQDVIDEGLDCSDTKDCEKTSCDVTKSESSLEEDSSLCLQDKQSDESVDESHKESAEESPIVTPEKKTRGTPTPRVTPAPPPAKKNTKPEKAAAEDDTPTGSKRSRGKSATSDNKDAKPTQESSLKTLMQCGMFVQIFGYLNKRELAAAARVCRSWRDIAYTPSLWRTVRMKNTQVTDWQGLATALKKHKTRHLDLRKMLLPADDTDNIWDQFTKHIACVDSLLRIELCRCPASVVERVCKGLPQLQALTSTSIRCAKLNPSPLSSLTNLTELRIKGMNGLNLTSDLKCLEHLTKLKHLSITSIRELEKLHCESIGSLSLLESLELGECTFPGESGADILGPLRKLARLRLEKSPPDGAAQVVQAAAALPKLTHLELINFEIKAGFEDALAACTNVKRLLIIPMYISQSATTNHCVLDGVLRLRNSLTHLVWGVTIELLRVTELFIDQCDRPGEGGASRPPKAAKKSNMGDCIPVLKPVPGLSSSSAGSEVSEKADRPQASPAQVEILPLPALQHLLTTELPDTRLKILRIPFHSTWRQALSDLD